MAEISSILTDIESGRDLSVDTSRELFTAMLDGYLSEAQIAGVLTALSTKGETAEEIAGCIKAMRSKMIPVKTKIHAVDTCGTGGDHSGTFNISTAVGLTVAACGVPVAKHGNRSATSKCGSADVLEQMGISIGLTPEKAADVLLETGFVFLFAPAYHPSLKHVMPVRKQLGIRTIFNFVGPFCNPAKVKRQLIGVPNPKIAATLAEVAAHLRYEDVMIVSSLEEFDEIGLSQPSVAYRVRGRDVSQETIQPSDYDLLTATKADLRGGDARENAEIMNIIYSGENGAHRDIVVLNAAHVLELAGKTKSISDGIKKASRAIDSGSVLQLITQLQLATNS